jgi:hypothetical protein
MTNFRLTPYSHWLLWAALILLIVFIIITVVRTVPLLKALSHMQKDYLDHIKEGAAVTKIKVDTVKEKQKQTSRVVKPLITMVPLLFAILKNYRQDDEKKGMKGMRKAADEEIVKKFDKDKIRTYLKNFG